MEYALRRLWTSVPMRERNSLNPCSNGICAQTGCGTKFFNRNVCRLNPCSNGICAQTLKYGNPFVYGDFCRQKFLFFDKPLRKTLLSKGVQRYDFFLRWQRAILLIFSKKTCGRVAGDECCRTRLGFATVFFGKKANGRYGFGG